VINNKGNDNNIEDAIKNNKRKFNENANKNKYKHIKKRQRMKYNKLK